MKLFFKKVALPEFNKGTVATVGNFDGVHLGHQNLMRALKIKANNLNLPFIMILFEPQPREYFLKENAPARLSTLRDKLQVIKQCGVDYVYCIRFTQEFAQTEPADFIQSYLLDTLNVNYLLVGEDFRFGKNRAGDTTLLKKYTQFSLIDTATYPDFCVGSEKVSSTKIRRALELNDLSKVRAFLGREYSLSGRVIHGAKRGRQWGIPTANIKLNLKTPPVRGVYVVRVQMGKIFAQGVANVGTRPTVDGIKSMLEVHLFDFDKSIYGEFMQVFFLHKLRDEVKFSSIDTLLGQIHNDIAQAKAYLTQYP